MKPWILVLILIVFLGSAMLMGVAWGTVSISWTEVSQLLWTGALSSTSNHDLILLQLRLPRVLLGALVGFSLGLCGAVMQGVFRNPLAEPYLLGIASGSTAGAAVTIVMGFGGVAFLLPLGALIGGLFAVGLVLWISQTPVLRMSNYTLILAGVAIGAVFSSVTSFLMFFSHQEQLQQVIFWMMGSLSTARWESLGPLALLIALGSGVLFTLARDINAISLGDDMAQHLGIHPQRLKRISLFLATLLTASAVAFSGTIGFVGLIVPHAVRLFVGPDHRWLFPISGLVGATFLVLCDLLSRIIVRPAELPVGIITALFGAPFFLYLLKTYRSDRLERR